MKNTLLTVVRISKNDFMQRFDPNEFSPPEKRDPKPYRFDDFIQREVNPVIKAIERDNTVTQVLHSATSEGDDIVHYYTIVYQDK